MIPSELLKLNVTDDFLKECFDGEQFPELILIELEQLQIQLDEKIFDPADYLTSQELTTLYGFRYHKRKLEWLGGRLAAKQAVLQLTGSPLTSEGMREWVIIADQYGKPFFKSPSENAPELSISHSHGLASAVASRKKACGLDIQKVSEATIRIKEKFCTTAEERMIASLNLVSQPALGLTLLWASKEALRKARGGHPLTGFTAMRLTETFNVDDYWLFTMQVNKDQHRILTFFYKDYAMALSIIQ